MIRDILCIAVMGAFLSMIAHIFGFEVMATGVLAILLWDNRGKNATSS